MSEFKPINIRGKDDTEKLKEVIGFIYQLVEQLNYEFGQLDNNEVTGGKDEGIELLYMIKNLNKTLTEKINALETNIGDIGTILDEINGEVI